MMKGIREAVQPALAKHIRSPVELSQVQAIKVEHTAGLWIGRQQHLKATI
jgi:hypothetical protein